MFRIKNWLAAALVLLLAFCASGCGGKEADKSEEKEGKLQIVTTIFPAYDWASEIVGESGTAEITLLIDNGVDLHSYQPDADDMIRIASCDLFIYTGGESDRWVADALENPVNSDRRVVRLLEALGDRAREEETVEGMQAEEHDEDGEDEAEEGPEYDEHVWLSLRNAGILCGLIARELGALDPEHAETYAANADAYTADLDALDKRYKAAVEEAPGRTLLFGDRFPFRYMTEDYGLDYYAAFAGCSAETEASFETIITLAGKVDALGLPAICQIETSDGSVARTVRDATEKKDQEILTFDSIQMAKAEDRDNGLGYLARMEQNLEVLTKALGQIRP